VRFGLPIPRLLSLLARHDPDATIRGLSSFPAADLPPVNVVRVAFQTMVGLGMALALLAVCFLWVRFRRGRQPSSTWFYRAVVLAGPAAIVALLAGWVTTEVGRQPWVVYGVMRTGDAVTGASGIPVGYGVLVAVYAGVVAAVWWILRRLAGQPFPEQPADVVDEVGVP
jgi:cytochrome d ubiquinol oxidase subunit I